MGLNAEGGASQQAQEALAEGECQSVDPLDFVIRAIESEDGECKKTLDGVWSVRLPNAWNMDPSQIPGFDKETEAILLSDDPNTSWGSRDGTVAYLGRAHPLVQKAIDRVRSVGSAAGAGQRQDRRVSAAESDKDYPELLCTFLGRVTSKARREYERVIAVRVNKAGNSEVYCSPKEWLDRLKGKAVSTKAVWANNFANWGDAAQEAGVDVARGEFASIGNSFIEERRKELKNEQAVHDAWLREMADRISGKTGVKPQQTLFDSDAAFQQSQPVWQKSADPEERLASFASDKSVDRGRRSQAETILKSYQRRKKDVEDRMALSEPEVVPIGLLMLVTKKEVRCGS